MKNKSLLFVFALLMFSSQKLFSQTPLMDRLCHTWVLQFMDDGTGKKTVDDAQKDFRLMLMKDMTCKQGLQPDGLIPSTWKLDETGMTITITDLSAVPLKEFKLKIIKITNEEMELQQQPQDGGLMMYYKNHDL